MAGQAAEEAYVALLRGINVGGNNLIPMKALKVTFERLGFSGVRTYIQSGNVIFRSHIRDARALERRIEAAVKKDFACESRVIVRSRGEMQALARALPRSWKKPDPANRYYVMFLRHTVDTEAVLDRLDSKPDIEEVVYRPGAVLWSADISRLSRSATAKFVSTPLYKDVTIRNLNTTMKLCALLEDESPGEAVKARPATRASAPAVPRHLGHGRTSSSASRLTGTATCCRAEPRRRT